MSDDQKTNGDPQKVQPAQDLFFEASNPDKTNYPVRIGALFAHKDGKGHSIDDNGVLGLKGRLFTRDASERLERLRGGKEKPEASRDGQARDDQGAER